MLLKVAGEENVKEFIVSNGFIPEKEIFSWNKIYRVNEIKENNKIGIIVALSSKKLRR